MWKNESAVSSRTKKTAYLRFSLWLLLQSSISVDMPVDRKTPRTRKTKNLVLTRSLRRGLYPAGASTYGGPRDV